MKELIETLGKDMNKYMMQKDGVTVNYSGMAVFFGIPLLVIILIVLTFVVKGEDEAVGSKAQMKS